VDEAARPARRPGAVSALAPWSSARRKRE
jgi:hypothetical protein